MKHIQRAGIILYSAVRLLVLEVARLADVSRPTIWRWQRNFAEGGVERLLREGSRKLGKAPKRYLKGHNDNPKPFVWAKPANEILAKFNRLALPSE